ncbi:penicillin-binding protein 2 [Candidatus Aerophobetes bacterium]|uniref:Penicillin-binding protein 2 n=1 Tax=Aerophobetes bacterium TaxID=2030807 RepID=A0A523TGU0_UNCAE|nr:MAG: penicillin-binding protein 2 [Candidatus Aerophobetes bacterium]
MLNRENSGRIHIYLPFLAIFFAFMVVEARLYWLQIVQHAEFSEQARGEQIRKIEVAPKRGTIYDRNLQKLAINIPSYSLYARPKKISNPKQVATLLAPLVKTKSSLLRNKLEQKQIFVWLKRKLPLSQKKQIENLNLEGIGFVEESNRFYPQKELASHVLGFVGVDNQGLAGVEFSYDNELKGQRGHFWIRRDALGYEIPFAREILQTLVPGKDLVLTIDSVIQSIVEEELAIALKETQAKSVEALFMDPHTGEILALSRRPSYDPNHYGDYPASAQKNHLIQSIYEPGSTFKVATASVLLEENLVDMKERIFCENTLRIADHIFHDWKEFNTDLDFYTIVQHSSDIGMIKLASRINNDIFFQYIKHFGFGTRTGVDLPGEEKGIARPSSSWSLTDPPCIAIGHGIAVTPLQMVTFLSAAINGGKLLRPYVVRAILEPGGRVIKKNNSHLVRTIISDSTSSMLREFLKGVVAGGTGERAGVSGYFVGGKTGTAQIPLSGARGYAEGRYISSFMGFAPVGSPKVAGIVIIKEPTGAYWGGEIAAPVFGRIIRRALPYMNVLPEDEKWVKVS